MSEGLPSFLEYYAQHQKFGYDVAKPNTPTYQWELFNTQFGAVPQMLAVLRKFGSDAHLYLPGIGTINGITAGNYLDSIGTTPASVDGNVGLVLDGVGGLNATQATTGYQPKLRRVIVNNYTYSNDASNAAYSKTNITVSTVDGKQKITPNAGSAQHYVSKIYTAVSGNAYTKAVAAKAAGFDWVWVYGSNPVAHAYFNVATGQIGNVTGGTATIAQGSDGYYVCALSCTATGAAWPFETHSVASNGGGSTTTGDGTKGTLLKACAVFDGTLTAQQILDAGGIPLTTTAPASSPAGAYKLEFDGVDDYMSLGVVPFQMSDDHCVIAMGNNLAGSGTRYIIDFGSAGSANPICGSVGFSNSAVVAQWRDDAGTANLLSGGNFPLGTQAVVTARKVGNSFSLRANGAQVLANLATLSTTTLTGGKIGVRVFGSNLYQGVISGVVVIKGTVSDAQALIFERGLNALSQYAAGRF